MKVIISEMEEISINELQEVIIKDEIVFGNSFFFSHNNKLYRIPPYKIILKRKKPKKT